MPDTSDSAVTIARGQGRRGLAALLRASAAPVHAMVTFGDRSVVPLTRPGAGPG